MKNFVTDFKNFMCVFSKYGWQRCALCVQIVLKNVLLFLVQFYRVFLSAWTTGGACRFMPSCSLYAEQALLSHPPIRALILILKRLRLCHSFGPFGADPCPRPSSSTKTTTP